MKKQPYNLPVQIEKEGKQFTAYCRALDLATCGDTLEEAKKNIIEAIELFIDECNRMGTTKEVLRSCGWTEKKSEHRMYPPQLVGQIETSVYIAA